MTGIRRTGALATTLLVSSLANIAGGFVLCATWAINRSTDPERHVPLIVLAIGAPMIIQGLFTAGTILGWWEEWEDLASGALLAGQLISSCAGLGLLVSGILHNVSAPNGDIEMAPVLAGFMIGMNGLLALILLLVSGKLSPNDTPSRNGRHA